MFWESKQPSDPEFLKISKELTDLMKEPTKNRWFRVFVLCFFKPEGCDNGQDRFYDVRTCSLILRTHLPVQDRHMHYLYSSVPGSNKVTTLFMPQEAMLWTQLQFFDTLHLDGHFTQVSRDQKPRNQFEP
jgi:hypothetical protein